MHLGGFDRLLGLALDSLRRALLGHLEVRLGLQRFDRILATFE
jgi:hypothetical protein